MKKSHFLNFLKSEAGTTAVEFGILATPFFISTMFIAEIGMMFFANVVLEDAIAIAAREIRTGQVQMNGVTEEEFRNTVCENIDALLSCDPDKLYFDVRVFDQFADVTFDDPLDDENIADNLKFDPGDAEDIVLARVFYKWQPLTPMFGDLIKSKDQDFRLLNVNFVFRNEPFSF